MNTIPRSRRCKQCRDKFQPDRHGQIVHDGCIDGYVAGTIAKRREAQQRAAQRAKVKREREHFKARKEAIKRIPDLIKEAQVEFNGYVRLRDAAQPCICCGAPLGAGEVGGAYDCGHYRSVGSASHLRFDERNAHAQNKRCNRWGGGRAVDYRLGLTVRIGLEAVEALESDNTPHKWTREELIAIRATYKAKRRELEQLKETP